MSLAGLEGPASIREPNIGVASTSLVGLEGLAGIRDCGAPPAQIRLMRVLHKS